MKTQRTKLGAWAVVAIMLASVAVVAVVAKLLAGFEPPMCAAMYPEYAYPGVVSNLAIAAAYAWIPASMIWIGSGSNLLRVPAYAGAAFIVWCGAGHFVDALGYAGVLIPSSVSRAIDAGTALISVFVAWAFASMTAQLQRRSVDVG